MTSHMTPEQLTALATGIAAVLTAVARLVKTFRSR